jgi:hypothetical protein
MSNQTRCPLLGNGFTHTFPQQPSHVTATSEHAIMVGPLEAVFSAGSAPTLTASPINFQGDTGPQVAHGFRSTIYCADNKKRSNKIMKMQMFSTSENVKPDTENVRLLSLAVVKRTTVEVTRQPL